MTHWVGCWEEPRHWACAQREVADARRIACRLLAEKQRLKRENHHLAEMVDEARAAEAEERADRKRLEAERDFAQQDTEVLIACLQEIVSRNQPRLFLGAKLKLPKHLQERIRWPVWAEEVDNGS